MKGHAEKILADLVKKCGREHNISSKKEMTNLIIENIAYISKIRPNLNVYNPLSLKEMLCLILLAIGNNPDQCADILGISVNSVTTYEQRMRRKLGAKNRVNAFYLAQVRGYINVTH